VRRPIVSKKIRGTISALTLAAMPIWVSAHHSSAIFDQSRSLTLQGVVKEFRWTNPHASIQVLVKGDEGREEEWNVEMNSLDHLERAGWRPGALEPGDAVSLVVHPMRDGSRDGRYVSGTGPRGRLIPEQQPAPVFAQTPSTAAAKPSCPRAELTLVEASASAETRAVRLADHTVFVRRKAITTTDDISEIKVAGDDFDTSIHIKYKPDAAARLLDATTGHDGLKLAFVVDDDVWLAFTWQGPYGIGPDGTQLTIRHGLAKAQRLMESVRSCTDTQVL
jgi:Family of unknown function (DUF6152)